MERTLGLLLFFFFLTTSSFSYEQGAISDYDELILQVNNKGNFVFSEGIIALDRGGVIYLPVVDLFESLGLESNSSKDDFVIEGHIISKSRNYKIDFSKSLLILSDKEYTLEDDSYINGGDGLYLSEKIIEQILKSKIEVRRLSSQIAVISSYLFPPEQKAIRSKKDTTSLNFYSGEEVVDVSREWLSGFNFDQDIFVRSVSKRSGDGEKDVLHQSSISAEFLKSELYMSHTGIDSMKESNWISLSRSDHSGRIFGDLGATSFSLYNFNSPSVKLVGGAKQVRGAAITNRPFNNSAIFSKRDFSGAISIGWEVELYQNGIFIARDVGTSQKQRYEFKDIDLYYGANNFHFIFYGPKGEIKHSYEKYNIDDSFTKTTKPIWTFSGGVDEQGEDHQYAQVDYLFWNRLYVESFYTSFFDRSQKQFYGLNFSAYLGSSLISLNNAFSNKDNAIELSSKFKISNDVSTQFSFIKVNGLDSQLLEGDEGLSHVAKLTMIFPLKLIPNLQLFTEFNKNQYDDYESLSQRYRLSYFKGGLYSSLYFEDNDGSNFFDLFNRVMFGKKEVKLETRLNANEIKNINLEFRHRENLYSASGGFSYNIAKKEPIISLGYNHRLKYMNLGGSIDHGKTESVVGINLSYGLSRINNKTYFYEKKTTAYGSLSVIAFKDTNGNSEYDDGEELVQNVELRKVSGSLIKKTDDRGYASFTHLVANKPVDIKVSMKDVDNIYLSSLKNGFRIWPRVGKNSLVYIPLAIKGEVEGEVSIKTLKVSMSDLDVYITNIRDGKKIKVKVERDGYFWKSNIDPGEYSLTIKCSKCDNEEVVKEFSMPQGGESLFIEGLSI